MEGMSYTGTFPNISIGSFQTRQRLPRWPGILVSDSRSVALCSGSVGSHSRSACGSKTSYFL